MERNYMGQGYQSGGASNNVISSGRRAGTTRSASSENIPVGHPPPAGADSRPMHQPRFGRRASPGGSVNGDGMEMDPPPKALPGSRGIPRPAAGPAGAAATGAGSAPPAASAAPRSGSAGTSGAGPSSKLAGLAKLKEAATARLVSRIPSAGVRTTGEPGGYVPSAMTHQPTARAIPVRGTSNGSAGSSGSSPSYGAANGRSASTGAATSTRPPSGRSSGSTGGAAAPASSQRPNGYGSGSSAAAPAARPQPAAPSSSYGTSHGERRASGSGGGAEPGGGRSGARPPPPVSTQVNRKPNVNPVAARAPELAPAPPPPQPAPRAQRGPAAGTGGGFGGHDSDFGGGGGFGGGGDGAFGGGAGGGFASGSLPPGLEEDAGPTGPMVECPTCGRNFNQQAYGKHAKVCEKVFATKRKPVNMAAKRLEGTEAVKFFDLRKGVPKSEAKPAAAPAGGSRAAARGLDDRPLPGSKLPKWKAQSEQLRAAMSTNRKIADAKAKGVDIKDVKFEPSPAAHDDRVQCPHCGRKFAELTAERHIPKCKDILAKPGRLTAHAGKGAHARR